MSLAPAQQKATDGAYRVMVVDDSAVIRGLISRWLDADPDITVVATAANGVMALRNLVSSGAEVVILDVEMPEMDGLTALPRIIEAAPHVKVIMASTLTRRNAEISVRALQNGAADYIPKPESSRDVNASQAFREEVVAKVKVLGRVVREDAGTATPGRAPRKAANRNGGALRGPKPSPTEPAKPLRKVSGVRPRVMVIGSSTGGPQALFKFFETMKGQVDVPVLVTQHMPATFTTILAEHLARTLGTPCKEGVDGMELEPGHIYLAPGDYHMTVAERGGRAVIRLDQNPPENYCRPAVDALFRTAARVFGSATLGVVLTGMGSDGLAGSRLVVDAGGTVIAQDEETSVVWGMPGAVTKAGLVSVIDPLDKIGTTAIRIIRGERP